MDPAQSDVVQTKERILNAQLPEDVQDKLLNLLKLPQTGLDFEKLAAYIDFCISLPFKKYSEDILDIQRAKSILDKNHFGLQNVKDRILEYLSILILNKKTNPNFIQGHAPILLFVGLVGTGKTSLAASIAECLGRPLKRIPFGGLGDPIGLRGQSRARGDAEPGQIIKAVKDAGVSNPVILLDEIDRVEQEHRVDIMGILVELLDPAQNQSFVDHYLDFPYDLSQVLFIATANNTSNIATAVLDRLEPIQMPSYTDEEKEEIGKNYLLPRALADAGITEGLIKIDATVWSQIIRPLGYDGGIRSLQRTLQGVTRKIARKIVEGESGPFEITAANVGQYLS